MHLGRYRRWRLGAVGLVPRCDGWSNISGGDRGIRHQTCPSHHPPLVLGARTRADPARDRHPSNLYPDRAVLSIAVAAYRLRTDRSAEVGLCPSTRPRRDRLRIAAPCDLRHVGLPHTSPMLACGCSRRLFVGVSSRGMTLVSYHVPASSRRQPPVSSSCSLGSFESGLQCCRS